MKHQHLHNQKIDLVGGVRPLHKFQKPRNDLSTTTVALYLLRYNVSLQIAVAAIMVNLGLAIATFWYGLNSLYCAFGMDCIIGVITACILVWRFASAKTDHLRSQQHIYLLNSYSSGNVYSTPNLLAANKYDLTESLRECENPNPNDPDDHVRELWSTFWLGQAMILAGIGVVIRTVIEIVSHVLVFSEGEQYSIDRIDYGFDSTPFVELVEATSMEPLFVLASISLGLNLLLMAAKILVYVFLKSNSMLIEGINSFISALFAAVSMISIRYSESFQYLDQIVSILFGIFLIVYGGYNMLVTVGQTVYQVVKKSQRPGYDILV